MSAPITLIEAFTATLDATGLAPGCGFWDADTIAAEFLCFVEDPCKHLDDGTVVRWPDRKPDAAWAHRVAVMVMAARRPVAEVAQ